MTAGHAACNVELDCRDWSLTAASEALSSMSAILVALFLVALATAVVFAAKAMKRSSMKVCWQPSVSA